jgi:hypothetical protein
LSFFRHKSGNILSYRDLKIINAINVGPLLTVNNYLAHLRINLPFSLLVERIISIFKKGKIIYITDCRGEMLSCPFYQ